MAPSYEELREKITTQELSISKLTGIAFTKYTRNLIQYGYINNKYIDEIRKHFSFLYSKLIEIDVLCQEEHGFRFIKYYFFNIFGEMTAIANVTIYSDNKINFNIHQLADQNILLDYHNETYFDKIMDYTINHEFTTININALFKDGKFVKYERSDNHKGYYYKYTVRESSHMRLITYTYLSNKITFEMAEIEEFKLILLVSTPTNNYDVVIFKHYYDKNIQENYIYYDGKLLYHSRFNNNICEIEFHTLDYLDYYSKQRVINKVGANKTILKKN